MVRRRLKKFAKVIAILLIVGLGLSVAAAYAGIEPLSTYKDIVKDEVATSIVQQESESKPSYPRERRFKGTYTTIIPWLGTEQTLTFKGATVTIADELTGRNIFRYVATMQSESEGILELIDITTGEVSLMSFEYVEEADCIVLYPLGKAKGGMTYCR